MASKVNTLMKNTPNTENPEPDGFPGKLHQTFKELAPILLNPFPKKLRRDHFQTHSMRPALL